MSAPVSFSSATTAAAPVRELARKRQELAALLDITQAVNNEALTATDLYRTFGFTLLGQLGFSPVALFVPADPAAAVSDPTDPAAWICPVALPPARAGQPDLRGAPLPAGLADLTTASPLPPVASATAGSAFRTVLPVRYGGRLLAYVLLGEALRAPGVGGIVPDPQESLSFVQTLSSIVLVAAQNRALAQERLARQVLEREIEIARQVQTMLFPRHLPNDDDVAVHATYIPHSQVSGDFYDCQEIAPGRYLLAIADVSGKGIPAALLMANFQAGLRTLARRTDSLLELVTELNYLLYTNAQAEKFITAFIAFYDAPTRELRYVNAGHNPPMLFLPLNSPQAAAVEPRAGNSLPLEFLTEGTLMLGIMEMLPFLQEGRVTVPPGSQLLCYTDGLTEVFAATAVPETDPNAPVSIEFGEQGVAQAMLAAQHLSLPALHDHLLRDMSNFSGSNASFADDITMLSCRFK